MNFCQPRTGTNEVLCMCNVYGARSTTYVVVMSLFCVVYVNGDSSVHQSTEITYRNKYRTPYIASDIKGLLLDLSVYYVIKANTPHYRSCFVLLFLNCPSQSGHEDRRQ